MLIIVPDEKEALREKESATLIALAEKRKDGENISLTRLSLDRRADELHHGTWSAPDRS